MEIDDRDSAKCQKSKRRDTWNFGKRINEEKDKNVNSGLLPSKRPKKGAVVEMDYNGPDFVIFLEKEHILSRIPGNRTVGSRRSKKQSYSRATRGHQFGGVPRTPRGRDLFLLVLILV